ncbi:catalase family peroxidase [Nocardia albiluteola]|uniref:catalase family peroxidase n=1 Tax=Nocardia albiluteola TaxID=2842303 RepID=UPI003556DBA8
MDEHVPSDPVPPPESSPPEHAQPPGAGLSRRGALAGIAAVGGISAVNVGAFAWAAGWFTPDSLRSGTFVDRFERVYGRHNGFRRNHAKGVSASGTFVGNGAGTALSTASVFRAGTTPVTARFSLSGGMPLAGDQNGTVRGLAVLFHLDGREQWRTAMVNIPVFLDRVPRGFYDRMLATQPVGATGRPDPVKVAAFLAKYPESERAMAVVARTTPSNGFANSPFHGLNAFRFTNAAGTTVPVRWSLLPEDPFVAGTHAAGRDYLFDALIERLGHGPVRWRMVVTVAEPGDPTNDATRAWPATRRQVEVGTLTIDALATEAPGNARDVNFDPTVLPTGIAPSDDPLLEARSSVYARSYQRRTREPHTPSAVEVPEVRNAR